MSEPGSGEAKPVKVLTEKAKEIGLSIDSLRRVKNELGIRTYKEDPAWYWRIK